MAVEQSSDKTPSMPPVEPEQLAYAGVLGACKKLGLTVLTVTFSIYVLGLCAPHVAMHTLSECWTLPADEFMHKVDLKHGWGWTKRILDGDYMNLIGVVVLASTSVVCYLRIIPMFWRRRDFIYLAIAVLEIAIMVLAASGILSGGH